MALSDSLSFSTRSSFVSISLRRWPLLSHAGHCERALASVKRSEAQPFAMVKRESMCLCTWAWIGSATIHTISPPFFPSLPRAWVSQDTIMLDHLSRSRARPALHATRFARGHLRRSRYVRNLEIMRLYIDFNTFCKSIR